MSIEELKHWVLLYLNVPSYSLNIFDSETSLVINVSKRSKEYEFRYYKKINTLLCKCHSNDANYNYMNYEDITANFETFIRREKIKRLCYVQ